MYPKYNIPQQNHNMQTRRNYPVGRSNNGDRLFLGGGFLGPFLLGGIAGSLVSRPNYGPGFGSGFGPGYGPPPIIYYPPIPAPYNTNNYYY